MGTVYMGVFAEQVGYEAHEGYGARILPDGTETGVWTYATRVFTGYRARCACGWRGLSTYPPTDDGAAEAEEEWDRDHLRLVVDAVARRHTVTADVLVRLVHELRGSLTTTVNNHGEPVLTDRSRGMCDAIEHLEHLLDTLPKGH